MLRVARLSLKDNYELLDCPEVTSCHLTLVLPIYLFCHVSLPLTTQLLLHLFNSFFTHTTLPLRIQPSLNHFHLPRLWCFSISLNRLHFTLNSFAQGKLNEADEEQLLRMIFQEDPTLLRCFRLNRKKGPETLLKRMNILISSPGYQFKSEAKTVENKNTESKPGKQHFIPDGPYPDEL